MLRNNYFKKFILLLFIASSLLLFNGCSGNNSAGNTTSKGFVEKKQPSVAPDSFISKPETVQNSFDTLCVPTQFTKIGEDYFIVDCYHNQILTSEDKMLPLSDWQVMYSKLNMGHSIAGDGVVYMVDDTDNNRVLVFTKYDNEFLLTQIFENTGVRPHYVQYDEQTGKFIVLSSLTGEFYIFERKDGEYTVELKEVKKIKALDGIYARTFTIIDNEIYIPAGDGRIYLADKGSFKLIKSYELATEYAGPVQLLKINDYYYLTISTDIYGVNLYANIIRAKNLSDFSKYNCESLRSSFCEDGTPYVISFFDNEYHLALHSEISENCLWNFTVSDDNSLITQRQFTAK